MCLCICNLFIVFYQYTFIPNIPLVRVHFMDQSNSHFACGRHQLDLSQVIGATTTKISQRTQ